MCRAKEEGSPVMVYIKVSFAKVCGESLVKVYVTWWLASEECRAGQGMLEIPPAKGCEALNDQKHGQFKGLFLWDERRTNIRRRKVF